MAQRARDDGQHDVVDRPAERVLDVLEVLQLAGDRRRSGGAGRSRRSAARGARGWRRPRRSRRAPRRRPSRPRARARAGSASRAPSPPRRASPSSSRRCPRVSRSSGDGAGSGIHGSRPSSGGRPSGPRSKRTVPRSTPAMPSIIAWWVLDSSAKPPPARPSTSHSSHSGLERSSCWEKMRAARFMSCSSLPGAGSAVWRTWYSRLKSASSAHSGRPVAAGGKASRWR